MEQELFELDMERQYEDDSFVQDEVNQELQQITESQIDDEVEAAYDEYLAEMFRLYYPPIEY